MTVSGRVTSDVTSDDAATPVTVPATRHVSVTPSDPRSSGQYRRRLRVIALV